MINVNDLKIPLVIGVTGHRDIPKDDIKAIEEKVREIFKYITDKYKETPIILLSPLADGADRIVAKIALKEFKTKITVSVPIPFDESTYKKTFGTNDKVKLRYNNITSIKEFNFLLCRVKRQKNNFVPNIILMPFDKEAYTALSDEDEKKKIRYKQYTTVGEYIAIHSQILIALQSPCSEGKSGGTAEIVNKKLSGNYDHVTKAKDRVSLPERGLVYRIITPRINHTLIKSLSLLKWTDNKPILKLPVISLQSKLIKCVLEEKIKYKLTKLFPSDNEQGNEEIPWGTNDKELSGIKKHWNTFVDCLVYLNSKPCITKNQAEEMNSFRREHTQINCLNKIIEENYNGKIEYKKDNDSKNKNKLQTNSISTRAANDLKKYSPKIEQDKKDSTKVFLNIDDNIQKEHKLRIKQIISRSSFAYLSGKFQNKTKFYEKLLLTLIFTSSLTFFVIPKLGVDKFITNIIYLFIIVLFYIFATKFKKYKVLYEDTRALSEGLRVQNTWKDLGIDESVAFSYPSSYKDELNWIRTSLRSLNIFSSLNGSKILNKDKEYLVRKSWIGNNDKGQIRFFKKNIKEKEPKERIYKKIIKYLTRTTIALGSLLAANNIYQFIDNIDNLKILTGVFFTFAAVFKSKEHFDGYSKIIKEYKLSLAHFLRAKELLEDEKNDKKKIYKSLGIEALQENTFWTILRREKNYKSPSL